MAKLKRNEADISFLAETIAFYLSETIEDLSDWDCEHLAINLIDELEIKSPKWRDNKRDDE